MKKKYKNKSDRFVKVGTLKSGKEWLLIGEKQSREVIKRHKLQVDEKMFRMKSLDISLVTYKGEDVCLWFMPKDDEDAKRIDIPPKKREIGNTASLPFGLDKLFYNKYKMNGVDCGEMLLYVYC
mgnify:CR=1 FL=1